MNTADRASVQRVAWWGTGVVVLNQLINGAHGYTHLQSDVPLALWQQAFVLLVIFLAPIVAAVLLWTAYRRAGAALLTLSMLASLAFGVYFHFIADTVDHVSHRHADAGGRFFVITAALLIPAAIAGAAVGAWSWQKLSRAN